MDENLNQEAPKMSSVESEHEEFEMSHTDKLVGVFSEPGKTFEKMAKFPIKTVDWIIPLLVLIVVIILASVVLRSNPAIKRDMIVKTTVRVEKQFNEAVKKGQMTQEQADQQLEKMRENMEQGGTLTLISTIIATPIFIFIVFFFMSAIYLILAKLILKGDGSYKDVMAVYGLTHYISILQMIGAVIAAFITSKYMMDTSVADFLESDKTSVMGFVFGKLNIFSFWFFTVFGIGLAKMFKSANTAKYVIGVFCTWIILSLVVWVIARAVPFLSFLAG
jgi:hypothetical protein